MQKKNHKNNWLAFLCVLAFLALVLFLDQKIKPTNSMYMLMTVLHLCDFHHSRGFERHGLPVL